MASSIAYSTLLGLAQPVNGQEAGTWGDDINLGLTNYLDSAIAGTLTISSSSDATLSISNYSTANPNLGSSSSQYMILSCTANLSAVQHINVPQTSKMYLVFNGTTGSSNNINVRGYTGSTYTTGVTLVPGERALVAYSLSANDVIKVSSNFLTGLTGTFTSGGVVYANTTSTLTTSGALTQYGVLYGGGAGGAPLATAAGTNNQLLVATTSAAPSWINPSSVTVGAATTATNLSGGSAQAIPYQSASGTTTFLGATTAGSLLQTNNTGSAPSWTTSPTLTGLTISNGSSGGALTLSSTSGLPLAITALGSGITSYFNFGYPIINTSTRASSFAGQLTITGNAIIAGVILNSASNIPVSSPNTATSGSDGGWTGFTPAFSTNITTIYTYTARYMVMGNLVYVQFYINFNSSSSGSYLSITNLPITSSTVIGLGTAITIGQTLAIGSAFGSNTPYVMNVSQLSTTAVFQTQTNTTPIGIGNGTINSMFVYSTT